MIPYEFLVEMDTVHRVENYYITALIVDFMCKLLQHLAQLSSAQLVLQSCDI